MRSEESAASGTRPYFNAEPSGEADPAFPPRLESGGDIPSAQLAPGVRARPVVGRDIQLNYVHFEPHSEAPLHSHPEEQMGTLLEGELEFEMGGETRLMRPGDVWVVPPHVPHAARTRDTPCVALDVFSPPRGGFGGLLQTTDEADGSDH